jgi:hypothetical protein
MTNPKRKPGRKPQGKPLARQINFSVSAEHHAWLLTVQNRSAWLAQMIENERKSTPKLDNCADPTAHPNE